MSDRLLNPQQVILKLNGSPKYVGTITSNGTSTTTLSSGSLTAGNLYLLQTDAKCYFAGQEISSGAVTVVNGCAIQADGSFAVYLTRNQAHIAVISDSGTANVKVFLLE